MLASIESIHRLIDQAWTNLSRQELVWGLGFAMLAALSLFAVAARGPDGFRRDGAAALAAAIALLIGLQGLYSLAMRDFWPTIAEPAQGRSFDWPPRDLFCWLGPLVVAAVPLVALSTARGPWAGAGWLLEAGLAVFVLRALLAPVDPAAAPVDHSTREMAVAGAFFLAGRIGMGVAERRRGGLEAAIAVAALASVGGLVVGGAGSALLGKSMALIGAVADVAVIACFVCGPAFAARAAALLLFWPFAYGLLFARVSLVGIDRGILGMLMAAPLALALPLPKVLGSETRLGWSLRLLVVFGVAGIALFRAAP